MTAASELADPQIPAACAEAGRLAQLRQELSRRFPGVVVAPMPDGVDRPACPARTDGQTVLHAPSFSWVEVAIGDGGLAWLAAWTSLVVARDALGRPALWVDTHGTFTPGDLLDLEGKLVVVRPKDPHEAHVAADIALRAGSFSLVALEMHRALHPKPLARLARLASARAHSDRTRTPLVLWGEPPSFVAPPSGVPRTPFNEASHALYEGLAPHPSPPVTPDEEPILFNRAPHSTDRLRPLDRAADRRASASGPRPQSQPVHDGHAVQHEHEHEHGPADGSRGRVDEHVDRPRLSSIPYSLDRRG